ncbi:MAG: ATP-binding protein [Oryzihumus sp.]
MVTIRVPGYEDYVDGSANLKTIILGPHGVGKTRWSSFWDRPLILAAEDGTAAILDRGVPMAEIHKSSDVLDVLALLKRAEHKPKAERTYRTVVLDTVDALQKMLMAEWRQQTGNAEFTGWEAWSWLDAKQAVIVEKLMALDYHVIVLLHYKEDKEDEVVTVRPRLKGDLKDSLFDPFDLVGFMDWEFGAEGGERVQKRFLSYVPTPKAVFLKDRFNVMPKKLPVTFATSDYTTIFGALEAKAKQVQKARVVEDVPPVGEDSDEPLPAGPRKTTVVGPEAGGPVPGATPPPAPKAKAAPAPAPAAPAAPAEPSTTDPVQASTLARAKAAQQAKVEAATPKNETPLARAQRLQAEARERAASKEAPATDASAEAAAFTEELATAVAGTPATPAEPAEPAEPASVEEAVANLEAAVGPVTEVDRMGLPRGVEGVGSGNAVPTKCGDAVGDVPEAVTAAMEAGTVGCGKPFDSTNQTFLNVSKIKYRAGFCDTCFTKVRTTVR